MMFANPPVEPPEVVTPTERALASAILGLRTMGMIFSREVQEWAERYTDDNQSVSENIEAAIKSMSGEFCEFCSPDSSQPCAVCGKNRRGNE